MSRRMVCQLGGSLKYHLCTRPVDMRKSVQGLSGIIRSEFGGEPDSDSAFIFFGKNKRTVKILHREGMGVTLYVRKLDHGSFPVPRFDADGSRVLISYADFVLLMTGNGITALKYRLGKNSSI